MLCLGEAIRWNYLAAPACMVASAVFIMRFWPAAMSGTAKITASALDYGDLVIPLSVRRSARARRITLRIDADSHGAILTLPLRASVSAALRFAEDKSLWVRNRMALLPRPVPFAPGAVVPLQGQPHRSEHRPHERGGVWRESTTIIAAGRAEHLPRRVTEWLEREALATLTGRTHAKAALLGKTVVRVAVRDTRSRWGSCSRDGRIHYCWRLILAPDHALDYVVAHEVAHLAYQGHGPRFWATVERLTPHRREAEAWLRRFGPGLALIGQGRNNRIEAASAAT